MILIFAKPDNGEYLLRLIKNVSTNLPADEFPAIIVVLILSITVFESFSS